MPERVVIVHDYLTQRGGAERVMLALAEVFPGSRILTSVYEPEGTFPEFQALNVETMWPNAVGHLRRDPRRAFPILAPVFSGAVIRDADVVICSSSGWAHGVRTESPKIVYCYNPPRWLHQTDEYLAHHGGMVRGVLKVMKPALVAWDQRRAATADRYLAISSVVADRIRAAYGIEAEVVAPPVSYMVEADRLPIPGLTPDFYLSIARGRAYKNVHIVCEAVETMPDARLVVVGDLPSRPGGGTWSSRIRSVGTVLDGELRWLYANCKATVTASHEDFGLTPLEGNAFGKPAAVLRAGGFLDTMREGVTGSFIDSVSVAAVAEALATLPDLADPAELVAHARSYGVERFADRMHEIVTEVLAGATARR